MKVGWKRHLQERTVIHWTWGEGQARGGNQRGSDVEFLLKLDLQQQPRDREPLTDYFQKLGDYSQTESSLVVNKEQTNKTQSDSQNAGFRALHYAAGQGSGQLRTVQAINSSCGSRPLHLPDGWKTEKETHYSASNFDQLGQIR